MIAVIDSKSQKQIENIIENVYNVGNTIIDAYDYIIKNNVIPVDCIYYMPKPWIL